MTYMEKKENARQKAIDWQNYYFVQENPPSISWGELFEYQNYFENLGRRYGLLGEFRENGIC